MIAELEGIMEYKELPALWKKQTIETYLEEKNIWCTKR